VVFRFRNFYYKQTFIGEEFEVEQPFRDGKAQPPTLWSQVEESIIGQLNNTDVMKRDGNIADVENRCFGNRYMAFLERLIFVAGKPKEVQGPYWAANKCTLLQDNSCLRWRRARASFRFGSETSDSLLFVALSHSGSHTSDTAVEVRNGCVWRLNFS